MINKLNYGKVNGDSEELHALKGFKVLAVGNGTIGEGVPIGTTQTTTTAMVYSQTWTNANGSGELYLTKLDKKILGVGNRIGYFNPYSSLIQTEEEA